MGRSRGQECACVRRRPRAAERRKYTQGLPSLGLDARRYWEERLGGHPGLTGTGHRAFGPAYNDWLYRRQEECVAAALASHDVRLEGAAVLDVGCGTGFWLDFYRGCRPARLAGVDLTQAAVDGLRARLPDVEAWRADIAATELPVQGPFDLISAFAVLFHILGDGDFERAVANLCRLLAPGGHLLITDLLRRPLLPTARHVRFRPFAVYEAALAAGGVEVRDVRPVFYLLHRAFLPVVGPLAIRLLRAARLLYLADRACARRGWPNFGGQKLIIARRLPPRLPANSAARSHGGSQPRLPAAPGG